MSNIDLKDQLAKQMLGYLHNELIKDANEPTLYRLSYGQYEVSSYKGELLIASFASIPFFVIIKP